jgi:SagB-type dehydrogenase family enzyme
MDLKQYREFMKSMFGQMPLGGSDQSKKIAQPPLQLPYDPRAKIIKLPQPNPSIIKQSDIYTCMRNRRSRRKWTNQALTLDELSMLLWATQGVQNVLGDGYATLRPVASGGARHPFESYLVINRVDGVDSDIYRYLPLSHELVAWSTPPDMKQRLVEAALAQQFVAEAAVCFIWTCVPYRGEWRYQAAAHKVMLMDAGHLCQNLYLACEALHLGTCAVGAYEQKAMDAFLGIDGDNEFVVYLAPVGKTL